MKRMLIAATAISCFLSCSAIAGTNDAFSFTIKGAGASKTLTFTGQQYAAFEESPTKLVNALAYEGVDCCAPQKKVSETVWQCCDGKPVIVASSARAANLLGAAFAATKSDSK
jgi:hypothetical protein